MKDKTILTIIIGTLAIACIVLSIFSYKIGYIRGVYSGANGALRLHNDSLCDLAIRMDAALYEDAEGYCVIANDTKDMRMDCALLKVRTIGDTNLTSWEKIKFLPSFGQLYVLGGCVLE